MRSFPEMGEPVTEVDEKARLDLSFHLVSRRTEPILKRHATEDTALNRGKLLTAWHWLDTDKQSTGLIANLLGFASVCTYYVRSMAPTGYNISLKCRSDSSGK